LGLLTLAGEAFKLNREEPGEPLSLALRPDRFPRLETVSHLPHLQPLDQEKLTWTQTYSPLLFFNVLIPVLVVFFLGNLEVPFLFLD